MDVGYVLAFGGRPGNVNHGPFDDRFLLSTEHFVDYLTIGDGTETREKWVWTFYNRYGYPFQRHWSGGWLSKYDAPYTSAHPIVQYPEGIGPVWSQDRVNQDFPVTDDNIPENEFGPLMTTVERTITNTLITYRGEYGGGTGYLAATREFSQPWTYGEAWAKLWSLYSSHPPREFIEKRNIVIGSQSLTKDQRLVLSVTKSGDPVVTWGANTPPPAEHPNYPYQGTPSTPGAVDCNNLHFIGFNWGDPLWPGNNLDPWGMIDPSIHAEPLNKWGIPDNPILSSRWTVWPNNSQLPACLNYHPGANDTAVWDWFTNDRRFQYHRTAENWSTGAEGATTVSDDNCEASAQYLVFDPGLTATPATEGFFEWAEWKGPPFEAC